MKLGLIEVSGIQRVVFGRKVLFVRAFGDNRYWVNQKNFSTVEDHHMMSRLQSYMHGKKFRKYRVFVSGDTVNIVKRDAPLSNEESYKERAVLRV